MDQRYDFILFKNNFFDDLDVLTLFDQFFSDNFNFHLINHTNDRFRSGYFNSFSHNDRLLDNDFFDNQLLDLCDNRLFFFINELLVGGFLNNLMDDDFFLDNEGHFFLKDDWNLNLNGFNFCLMYLYSLILDSISVSFHRHFPDDFDWHLPFHLNLNNLFFNSFSLHDSRDIYFFDLFLSYDHNLFDNDLNGYFYFLNDDLRNRYFNNLKLNFFTNYNLLDYFWNLNDPFDNTRHHHYLFNNPLDFNDPWNLNDLLDNSIYELRLNFYDFSFDNDGNRLVDLYRLHNFLFGSHNLHVLNLNFFYFFREVGFRDPLNDGNLFSDIERNNFLNLHVFGSEDLLNDRFVDKNLDLSDNLLLVSFYEVRAVDENLFWNFPNDLFFYLEFHRN